METYQDKSHESSRRERQDAGESLNTLSTQTILPSGTTGVMEDSKTTGSGIYFQWDLKNTLSPKLISENLQTLTGHNNEEFLTKKITYSEMIHPHDHWSITSTLRNYLKMCPSHFELPPYRLRHQNGQTIWVRHSMVRTHLDSTASSLYTGILFDITREKQREEELQSHENQLHFLLNSPIFPVVITSIDDSQILYINDLASTYFKIPAEQAIGLYLPDYWLDRPDKDAFFKEVLQNNAVNGYEATLKDHLGQEKCALLSTTIVTFAKQKAFFTVFSDITDRKNTERALKNSEGRYHDLYNMMKLMTDTAPDMIWAKDLNGSYIFANKAIRQHLRKRNNQHLPTDNDEKQEAPQSIFTKTCLASDQAIKQSRQPSRFLEDGFIQGEYLALDVYKTPLFDEQGTLIGTVGVGRDVTLDIKMQQDMQKSEKRYRLLAENVRDVIWTLDANLTPTFVTPSIQQLSGYSPEEFLAIPLETHLPDMYRKKFHLIQTLFQNKTGNTGEDPSRCWEIEFLRKDGKRIWIETTASAMPEVNGGPASFICITRETTKRVKEQLELVEAKETALAASQTKSEFLANMSHEIRTPMNGVLGMLQLLMTTPLNQEQHGYTQTALDSGKILLSLISDILDFSKIEAGRIELTNEPFELQPLLQSTIDSFYNATREKGITISISLHDEIPKKIVSDPSRLRQIITNLLGNAVKFTEKGNIAIDTTYSPMGDGQQGRLLFKVSDQGIGIPEQLSNHLFEPFVQADGSTSRKYGGTGLGLSIVRKLVEEMGGSVQLESIVDKGTTVYFDIVVHNAPETPQELILPPAKTTLELPSMNILVVEDEKINAMVLSAMLLNFGQKVTLAINGRNAIELTHKQHFDCILMDIQMPEMDGVATTKNIRNDSTNHCNKAPIIALTAHAMTGDKERFLAAGMTDYLSKPVTTKELQEALLDASVFSDQ